MSDERAHGWMANVSGGLEAHFIQPDGSTRPGVDWFVRLTDGRTEHAVLVRSYADEGRTLAAESELPLVFSFLNQLLESGWTPQDYAGAPGELVVRPSIYHSD